MSRLTLPVTLLMATLFLAGCESDEEKAEGFYQSGLELLESGDVERALVQFRNVFQHNGFHKEARETYASIQLERGETDEAYGQYLRLVEQYPDTVDARLTLAEISITRGNWLEVERHGNAALELAPDNPRAAAIAATIAYRNAVRDEDDQARDTALAEIRAVLEQTPDNLVARRVLIGALMEGRTPSLALPEVERALELAPNALDFHIAKLQLVFDDEVAAQAQLEDMFERFPDNEEVRAALIRWHMARQDFDAAEEVLRRLAAENPAQAGGNVVVVQFLKAARGSDAALAEVNRLVAAEGDGENADLYRSLGATIEFENGQHDQAIATMQEIIARGDDDDRSRKLKAALAQMLLATGNQVGARALVEEILAVDTSNVPALMMRASWQIDDDSPDAAVNTLRTALSQSPRDARIVTMMARAYERAGSRELANERLALAVEFSDPGAAESIRYARVLIGDDRMQVAEQILLDSYRSNPGHLGLQGILADLWLKDENWSRLQQMVDGLNNVGTPDAINAANQLRTAILTKQSRTEETLALLEQQASEADADSRDLINLVLAQVRAGNPDIARGFLNDALTSAPDDPSLRLLDANLRATSGEIGEAEVIFKQLIEDFPTSESAARLYYRLLVSENRQDDADAVLDAAIEAQPNAARLFWIKAGELEHRGDIDGAIEIYEQLYEQDSNNVVVANNLASLITTHRDDAEGLERAYAVARRLRGLNVPAFQDTYGWIEYRRGNFDEALSNLEPAAEGLPEDGLVQYHLGMTYLGLNRTDDAVRLLNHALELAGSSDLPQYQTARETLESIANP
ncbi:MAG: tetratricopeptide repeat protein [Rhodobacteraceae bacterium]|nr:tetratricopeptide repeat protein [Paracoccaceae bacterium]